MKVYGSSQNLSSFYQYCLRLLEEAGMDYKKALPHVEIYLGEVFRRQGRFATPYQIFDTEIDSCRVKKGEIAVKKHFDQYFLHRIGTMIRGYYFPPGTAKWRQLERMLHSQLDYHEYYCTKQKQKFCPAEEAAAALFEQAVRSCREVTIKRVTGTESLKRGKEEIRVANRTETYTLSINPHLWRKWFYQLWGQNYHWGSFIVGSKRVEIEGHIHFFGCEPCRINDNIFVSARDFLEAHGYKSLFLDDGTVEYWK